ncbi:MAG: GMC family oxidoreductase [Gemmatimonadetes bacterium]|nr:GMC family oxidoreductase [Gemmatimonadota bacterium]
MGSTWRHAAHRQVIVIGSGFGGAMAAWKLVDSGADVLMLERGPFVERGPHNWEPEGTVMRTPYYTEGPHYEANTDRGNSEAGVCSCVGGASVFYGGVSLRFRETDFLPRPEIVGDSGARWPFSYDTLEPYYGEAERILDVAGRAGEDPTEPPRTSDYPCPPSGLSEVSRIIAKAAEARGLHPFRLPLAINYQNSGSAPTCIECATCDTFACKIEAKNDIAVKVLRGLVERGLELRANIAVTGLHLDGRRVAGVECVDRTTGETEVLTADRIILAAGALGSAHLLLASRLAESNPAGDAVGRYLTRHCSAIVFGAYPWLPKHERHFHKQIGINDYYLGDPDGKGPKGPLGNIQQTQTPSMGTVRGELNWFLGSLVAPLARRITGLLVIAEDRPQHRNRVVLDPSGTDELGLPRLRIEHRYDPRDLEARRFLAGRAKRIHRAAGSLVGYTHVIDTFSHALGTVRMGDDPERAPVDRDGRFRGVDNLYVTDGSILPTPAAVNPSLTISANALRIGHMIAEDLRREGIT